ncbi:DUF3667 domain-containing protein [Parvularcula lutaonensis]|uniref:DUF3667 domain-containing protein n=1 Tax=Parvularcula lutaonensis TaxID=491923 RepID=A0ABV7MEI6_9PROT|nr:DUF3667 domain-containing protein [Parvularcula lutaonensis]GGY53787.1 hypothetical protein GCM10007148_23900 [Parvularcula lutaonensis]
MSSTTMSDGGGGQAEHNACLACGEQIFGPYCHACGQKNDDCRRSIVRLAGETVANVAALDGKFLRTVRSSLSRPGSHVHQYAHGKRSPFTPPVRFFFVVTFVFFATLWLTDRNIFVLQLVPEDTDISESNIQFRVTEDDEEIANLTIGNGENSEATQVGSRDDTVPADAAGDDREAGPLSDFRADIETVRGDFREDVETVRSDVAQALLDEGVIDEAQADEIDSQMEDAPKIVPYGGFLIKAHDLTYTEEEKEWLRSRVSVGEGFTFLGREMTSERLGDALIQTMQNPAAFNNALNEVIPFLLLLFVPLMAVLGTVFIRGRDALVYDHLLLAIQTHAFAFVVMTLTIWTGFLLPSEAGALAFLVGVPLYYLMGLRGAFHRSWRKSIATTVFVGVVYHSLFFFALLGAMIVSFWQIV